MIFSYNLPPFECFLVLQNGDKFRAIFFWGKVGLVSNLFQMNHKISIYYVEWRVVIHLLLALIVQCWYVFFCSKGLHRHNITLLGVHMSRYSSVCQWIYKSIQGSPRRLYQIVSCKTIIWLAVSHADHGSILIDSNFISS